MTHSNHRRGDRESLDGDYVFFIVGPSVKQHPDRARKAVEILAANNPVGVIKRRTGVPLRYMRNWKEGLELQELLDDPDPPIYIAGTFESKKDVEGVVRDLAEAELGISTVVSGVFENTFEVCEKVGTGPHTANMSMETLGRTERLPEDRILELMTMCGHSFVGEHICRHLIDRVRKGKMTAEDAGLELGKQCVCNFFNPVRAAKIIEEYTTLQR
jgi:hypothetical protein